MLNNNNQTYKKMSDGEYGKHPPVQHVELQSSRSYQPAKQPLLSGYTDSILGNPPPEKEAEDIEDAIVKAGSVGRFQAFSFLIIVMGMVSGAFWLYSLQYFERVPQEWFCKMTDDSEWTACTLQTVCNDNPAEFKPDTSADDYLNNWVTQVNLQCLDKFKTGMIGASFFIGTFIGSFILPRASDVYGRKPLTLIGLLIFFCVVLSSFFVTNLYLLYFIIFMGGISETGRYYVAYVYAVEMMPVQYQNNTGLWIFNVFGVAMCYIALQFWFITKYSNINCYISLVLSGVSFFSCLLLLPESPRFLYSRKRYSEARKVIEKIANQNGTDMKGFRFKLESQSQDLTNSAKNKQSRESLNRQSAGSIVSMTQQDLDAADEENLTGTLGELFGIKLYRNNLLLMIICWSFSSWAFFVVPFYLGKIKGNMYLMSLMTAIAEIIATFICMFAIHGRDLRKALALFCAISSVGSIGVIAFTSLYSGESQLPSAFAYMFLYIGVVTAFDLVYLIVNDLFPTVFLGTSYGACNVVGRFISIMSPLAAELPGAVPLILLAAFAAICTALPFGLVKTQKGEQTKSDKLQE